jgi:hypothetical protein
MGLLICWWLIDVFVNLFMDYGLKTSLDDA